MSDDKYTTALCSACGGRVPVASLSRRQRLCQGHTIIDMVIT